MTWNLNTLVCVLVVAMTSSISMASQNTFRSFIPNGFNLVETHCQADFNKDGKKDCVLLIKDTQESAWETTINDQWVDRNRRGIVILFQTNSGYRKALENKSLFLSENEDGGVYFAPELQIIAKKHKLEFHYGHGRYGSWKYIFDYRSINGRRDFYLIGYDAIHTYGPYIDYTQSVNFLTHKYRYEYNTDQTRESQIPVFETTWYDLPKIPPMRLVDIEILDGLHGFGSKLDSQLYDIRHADE